MKEITTKDLLKASTEYVEKIKIKNMTRAKFNVAEITKYGNGGGTKVVLLPVMSGSEENKAFWEYTPNGKIEIHLSGQDSKFEFGEYYIDFIKA